jgi:hypothetical protein
MTEQQRRPDSRRFARRLAAVVKSDLTDRAPEAGFAAASVLQVFDERAGVPTWQVECWAPDGSHAMITVMPLAAELR